MHPEKSGLAREVLGGFRSTWRLAFVLLSAAALSTAGLRSEDLDGYYFRAIGKSGAELRAALHATIRPHRVIPYSGGTVNARVALELLDQSPAIPEDVRLVYSGEDKLKSEFGDAGDVWNREHLWPNSYGIDDMAPMYSDLQNLRACDASVNSSRGNLPFDESDPAVANYRAPAHDEAPGTSRDFDSWEPREEEKGAIARALFYMDVCYEGDSGDVDLRLTDDMATVTASTANMGRLTTLIEWHLLHPPDEAERERNGLIADIYQANRNPFIDHPEWVLLVFGNPLWLEIESVAAGIVLRWPAGLKRAVLESSLDLQTWEVAPLPVTSTGGINSAIDARQSTRQFYRLILR